MSVGKKLRQLRKERNLTQDAVAAALQVTRQAVAKWESGQTMPSTANLLALADFFQVRTEELTCEKDETILLREYVLKKVHEEGVRAEKNRQIKAVLKPAITALVIWLGLIGALWLLSYVGILPFLHTRLIWNKMLLYPFVLAIPCMFCRWESLSYSLFIGTVCAILIAGITGYLTAKASILGFNQGWVYFSFVVCVSAVVGLILVIVKAPQKETHAFPSIKLQKLLRIFTVAGIVVCVFLSLYFSHYWMQRWEGAEEGYKDGYRCGQEDAAAGVDGVRGILTHPSRHGGPYDELDIGFHGYVAYWDSGYHAGYSD